MVVSTTLNHCAFESKSLPLHTQAFSLAEAKLLCFIPTECNTAVITINYFQKTTIIPNPAYPRVLKSFTPNNLHTKTLNISFTNIALKWLLKLSQSKWANGHQNKKNNSSRNCWITETKILISHRVANLHCLSWCSLNQCKEGLL
jgi:hypothetical protein